MKVIGRYDLGGETVELALRDGRGGNWDTRTPEKKLALLCIGMDDWPGVVGILLHEAVEFVAAKMGLRYRPSFDYAEDNGSSQFVMTHTQFSEVMMRVGVFLAVCLPDLAAAWRKKQ